MIILFEIYDFMNVMMILKNGKEVRFNEGVSFLLKVARLGFDYD